MKSSLNDGALRIYTKVDGDWVMYLDDGTTWKMSDNLSHEQLELLPEIANAVEGDQLVYRRRNRPIWIQNSPQISKRTVYCLLENQRLYRVAGDSDPDAKSRMKKMLREGLQCPPYSLFVSDELEDDLLLYSPDSAPIAISSVDQLKPTQMPAEAIRRQAAPRPLWLLLAMVLLCSIATWISLGSTERFQIQDTLLAQTDGLSDDSSWHSRGTAKLDYTGDGVTLTTEDNGQDNPKWTFHELTRTFRPDPGVYKMVIQASSTGISATNEPVWGAHTGMTLFDQDENRTGRFSLSDLVGDNDISTYTSIVQITEAMPIVKFQIRLMAHSGSMHVQNPALYRVAEAESYQVVRMALAAAWAATLLMLAFAVLRFLKLHSAKPKVGFTTVSLLLVVALGAILMLMPDTITRYIADSVNYSTKLPFAGEFNFKEILSASGHLLFFLLVGIIAGLFHQKVSMAFLLACIVVFAVFTESIQVFSFQRTPSPEDIIVDLIGGAIGFALGCLLVILRPSDKIQHEADEPISRRAIPNG
jgi:hypothetical protein